MKVLCIDDEPDILEVLSLSLKMRWPEAEVLKAEDGPAALGLFERENPHLIIADIGLPGMDGYEVIRRVRLHSDVPVIILSVRCEEQDIARGLELGADGYITKPFGHLELLARIQAILRRASPTSGNTEDTIEIGDLRIHGNTREVYVGDRSVSLTPIEYSILHNLACNVGRILTHQTLLGRIWGDHATDDRQLLTVHMNHLRSKLGDTGQERGKIHTERGVGYRMVLR
ncbi:MAG: response regulator transcription factor [Candidatus Thorarchaeota archaeon]|jgi:DNA-binding response OmpR family regulator